MLVPGLLRVGDQVLQRGDHGCEVWEGDLLVFRPPAGALALASAIAMCTAGSRCKALSGPMRHPFSRKISAPTKSKAVLFDSPPFHEGVNVVDDHALVQRPRE